MCEQNNKKYKFTKKANNAIPKIVAQIEKKESLVEFVEIILVYAKQAGLETIKNVLRTTNKKFKFTPLLSAIHQASIRPKMAGAILRYAWEIEPDFYYELILQANTCSGIALTKILGDPNAIENLHNWDTISQSPDT